MKGDPLSIILLPTLQCNVACDYCFEHKSKVRLTPEQLPALTAQLLDHMAAQECGEANLYWQGGEVLLLGADWFEQAHDLMGRAAEARGLAFRHYLQTNLIGWNERWHNVVRSMFGGSIGTSMDFPNAHRRLFSGSTERYTQVWLQAVARAREAGFSVGVIAVLHEASLQAGPQAFYDFFTQEAGLDDFQVNMPFPGGPNQTVATLENEPLGRFLVGLMDVWMEQGYDRGVRLGPFDELIKSFSGRPAVLPCIWNQNCAKEFVAIDARGQAALCDCWVTSYPEHSFGNIFGLAGLGEMLAGSEARQRFLERPGHLMEHEECSSCQWLSMCHGGCPVRTFTAKGTILAKDPYCEVYKVLFSHARKLTGQALRRRLVRQGASAANLQRETG